MERFLSERLTYDQANIQVVSEAPEFEGAPKQLYMNGIFIQGGVKNLNERVYPVQEIRRAVDNVNEILIKGESVLGEADHPEELNINLDRVSHMITKMWMDGPNGFGKLKILPTPMGNIVKTLLESGVKLGVSSRGSGNVTDDGEVSDFQIVTVDIVARPSAPNAYPKAVYEAKNGKRGSIIEDLAHAVKHDQKAQKHLTKELLDWINNLKA
jgi:Prohead core protein serine protease